MVTPRWTMVVKYGLPAAAVVFAAMTVYHVVRTQPGDQSVTPPIAPAKSPFAQALVVTGLVEPRGGPIAVAAPVPGIVAEVFVQVGQQVSPSAPLFRLDDRSLRAELKVREARLATAKAKRRGDRYAGFKAMVELAAKVLRLVWGVWRSGTPYDPRRTGGLQRQPR